MKISEIITDKYKLRMPPTVYYDLLADVVEAEEKQERILDKIRAEIMNLDDINPDYPMDRTIHLSRNEVLQIISKYKTESEGRK